MPIALDDKQKVNKTNVDILSLTPSFPVGRADTLLETGSKNGTARQTRGPWVAF